MATTMTARYNGRCASCNQRIGRGETIVYDRSRRSAYHPACHASGVDYTIFASGEVSYRNRNGRCEDAPCCDCCSAY